MRAQDLHSAVTFHRR